jgi:hypothetical protein
VEVTFALVFDTRTAAESAASTLRSDGYRVEFQPQTDGGLVVAAWRPLLGSEIEAAVRQMQLLAAEFGGDLLGHGGLLLYPIGPSNVD